MPRAMMLYTFIPRRSTVGAGCLFGSNSELARQMTTFSAYIAGFLSLTALLIAVSAMYYITVKLNKERAPTLPRQPLRPTAMPAQPTAFSVPQQSSPEVQSLKHEIVPAQRQKPVSTRIAKQYRHPRSRRTIVHFVVFLKHTVCNEYIDASKVPSRDLFPRYSWFENELYSIHTKGHPDLVLHELTVKTPTVAIELDGTSHGASAQIDRDKRKEELFLCANKLLLCFRTGVIWWDRERQVFLSALPKRVAP